MTIETTSQLNKTFSTGAANFETPSSRKLKHLSSQRNSWRMTNMHNCQSYNNICDVTTDE